MKDIYNDHTYLANNPTWHEEDAPFKAERILKLLRRNKLPLHNICEVGCGSGEILVQLAAQLPHSQFTGYDISQDAIAIAARKQTERIHFELRDLTQPTPAAPFDLLLVIDVIEHLPNYFEFLAGIADKSAYTLFHIPLDMSVWSLLREQMLIESKQRVGHIHAFTEDFVVSMLEDYGFEVVDRLYTEPVHKRKTLKNQIADALRTVLYAISPKFCTKTLGGYSVMVLTRNKAQVKS